MLFNETLSFRVQRSEPDNEKEKNCNCAYQRGTVPRTQRATPFQGYQFKSRNNSYLFFSLSKWMRAITAKYPLFHKPDYTHPMHEETNSSSLGGRHVLEIRADNLMDRELQ
ncbi:hypothetical protein TNCT_453801 [Trichonephila clavata]|uniref:Uncharacterized protein n=1 Tax=Trichonephila clavata TaxID=2740835 RepID=A0A8X6L6F7_TRICU|nr:hypothetical protein TNCT_453801 [Trichonephila clavata]